MEKRESTQTADKKTTASIQDAVILPLLVETKSGGLNRRNDPPDRI